MQGFYRCYAFSKIDYKNKLNELNSLYKVVQVFLPEKCSQYYEIVYTDDFEKQATVAAEAKLKKYYEDKFDRVFGRLA